jgi:hypothetical protein
MEKNMSPIEIALIIVGIIIIIVSCILVDRSQKIQKQMIGKSISSLEETLTEEDKKYLKEQARGFLVQAQEETVVHTEDTLSKISNEKIMAVNDFSEQVIEKIKRNHEEVVFLYNMLNDKEKELKATIREIDASKIKVQEILGSKAETDRLESAKAEKIQAAEKVLSQAQTAQSGKTVKKAASPAQAAQESGSVNGMGSNNNTQILALYSQGKSIVEISKLLGLGQGEVKLVIDLFKGKK